MQTAYHINTCLFDMDGVLIDSEQIWIDAIVYALSLCGVTTSREIVAPMEYGRPWPEIFQDIKSTWPGTYNTLEEMNMVTSPFYESAIRERDISIRSSVELLKRLYLENYVIAIVSGSGRKRISSVIDMLGIGSMVTLYLGCEDYSRGKPSPECYLEAARRLNVRPEECVVFEDAGVGVSAAISAGMKAVALRHSEHIQDLSHANLVLDDLQQFHFNLLQ